MIKAAGPHDDANSIAQLLSHLAWVERWWFERVFGDGPDLSADGRWPGFVAGEGRSVEDLIASYTSAWQRSNDVWDGASLDDEVETDHGATSMRWIVVT